MTAAIEARGIEKRYEGTVALHNVDFTLLPGEVHALLGENGAGKSTLAKVLAGVVRPDRGEIWVQGVPVSMLSPQHARSLGIGIVFQELDLFPHLTVAENLAAGNAAAQERFVTRRQAVERWCRPWLDQVGLHVDPGMMLADLSVSHRQLVAIARALSVRARVLLMDEPTSSLSQLDAEQLFAVLSRLQQEGVAIVYVSHRIAEVKRLANRLTVMRDGACIRTVEARGANLDELLALMVGRNLVEHEARPRKRASKVVLDVRSLQTNRIRDVRFQLRAGEVLGVAGLVGSGRSEIGAALFGLPPRGRLEATLSDRKFSPSSPMDAIRHGFCLVPEERSTEALFPNMSTLENAALTRGGALIRFREERLAALQCLSRLRLSTTKLDLPISTLSGGNQQKAVIARWLMANPSVLFLDEPTRGVDVGAKEEIYALINGLAEEGKGVLLVSSELPELLRCCDRILVLHEGRQQGILDVVDTNQKKIMALATGCVSNTASLS